jgi:predicted secreted hydrolase
MQLFRRLSHFITLIACATTTVGLTLSACGPAATPTPAPTPTPPYGLPPLALPADEASHAFQTEWWYFNVQLTSESGTRYALHDVIFQVQEQVSERTLYVRQIGLAEAGAATHVTAERLRTVNRRLRSEGDGFEIAMGEGSMAGEGGERYRLVGGAGGLTYDLSLTSMAPPLVHDDDGLVGFGEAGITYYYSRPRLSVAGTVTSSAGAEAVAGLGWLDKQWGDFQPVAVFWDWASVQLDDGTDLMLTNLRDVNGEAIDEYATLRKPGGTTQRLDADAFVFEPTGATWHSDRTDTTYETHWRVAVPDAGLDFTLEPLVRASEFASGLLGVVYWEAGADAVDSGGNRIGQGFIELNWARTLPFQ